MLFPADDPATLLTRRLAATQSLSAGDGRAIASLAWTVADLPPRTTIAEEGEEPSRCILVVDGMTASWSYTASGQRQIQGVYIPGDIPDLMSLQLRRMDHFIGTLSRCRIASVAHEDVRRVIQDAPSLADTLWRETLIEAAVYRATIIRNAKLSATGRLAHFLCELYRRMDAVGRVQNGSFPLPMTQEMIGEALGLTVVSVNRAIQALRVERMIALDRTAVRILDWDGLRATADFDPIYLHFEDERECA